MRRQYRAIETSKSCHEGDIPTASAKMEEIFRLQVPKCMAVWQCGVQEALVSIEVDYRRSRQCCIARLLGAHMDSLGLGHSLIISLHGIWQYY